MKVGVIGGGNIGTLVAAQAQKKGHETVLVTSKPDMWGHHIDVIDKTRNNDQWSTTLSLITDDVSELAQCSHIFVTVPPELFPRWNKKLLPVLSTKNKIIVLPGSGGAEIFFADLINKGIVLYGLQRVPFIARLKKKGHSVYNLGRKDKLYVGSIPSGHTIAPVLEQLWETPCEDLPNYLAVTLTPSNPILHTSRLYCLFKDYQPDKVYQRIPLFYQDWDDATSEVLLKADDELQNICHAIDCLDLSHVMPLRIYYEGNTPGEITQTISNISAFQGLETPQEKHADGVIPDFDSRYFTTDFPLGLNILRSVGKLVDVPTPMMDTMWQWYTRVNNGRLPQFSLEFPYSTKKELCAFYIGH